MGIKKQGYTPKKRNGNNRRRKSVIVIAAEGKNKTEKLYFKKFANDKVAIHFTTGGATDPENMMHELINECKDQDIDSSLGDLAFCFVDSDVNPEKNKMIKNAEKIGKACNAEVIVSGPCFEEWFMCHFGYSTKQYSSSEELVKALKTKIPGYCKNMDDIYELLLPLQDEAIKNAKRLEKYNFDDGRKLHTSEFQPSSEVYKVIEALRRIGENNQSK